MRAASASMEARFGQLVESTMESTGGHRRRQSSADEGSNIEDAAIIGVCIQTQLAPTIDASGAPSQFAANAGLAVIRPIRYLADLMASI